MYQSIQAADVALEGWIKSVVDGENVTFGAPKPIDSGSSVNVYLLGFAPPPSRGMQPDMPMQIPLRYLMTVWAENPGTEHEMLTKLVFGALRQPDFHVEFNEPSDSLWSAFGLAPRPCFLIKMIISQYPQQMPVHLVQKPLIAHSAFMGMIAGRVVDTKGQPIINARIGLPPLFESVLSEPDGSFLFRHIPAGIAVEQIGAAFTVEINDKKRKVRVVQDNSENGAISFTINVLEA